MAFLTGKARNFGAAVGDGTKGEFSPEQKENGEIRG